MDPVQFLRDIVEPNLADLRNDTTSLRKAFNVISAVDALAAHIHYWIEANRPDVLVAKDDTHYRQVLADKHIEFALLRDLAKANKHFKLTRSPRRPPLVSNSTQNTTMKLGWGEMEWADIGATINAPDGNVIVTDNSGKVRVVDAVVHWSLELLRDEMRSVGLLRARNTHP